MRKILSENFKIIDACHQLKRVYIGATQLIQQIDGAAIICYTEPNEFGYVEFENGERQQISVLAICTYNKEEFYVFACDDEFNVLGDTVHTSYDEAMKFAAEYYDHNETVWINI